MPPTNNVLDEARQPRRATPRRASTRSVSASSDALAELGGKSSRRRPGRPRGSSKKAAGSTGASAGAGAPRRRRKRRGGTRGDQAVKLIEEQPGISASDVAKKMKIKPNYLYRVLGDLEKEGQRGKGRSPVLPDRRLIGTHRYWKQLQQKKRPADAGLFS